MANLILMSDVDIIKYQTFRSKHNKLILATCNLLTWLDNNDLSHDYVDEERHEKPGSITISLYAHIG